MATSIHSAAAGQVSISTPVAPTEVAPAPSRASTPLDSFVAGVTGKDPSERLPDVAMDGAFIGAGGQAFNPAASPDEIPAVQPTTPLQSNERIFFVNGINTTRAEQVIELQALANAVGQPVVGIHNATEGMAKDLVQSLDDKLQRKDNPAVDTLVRSILDLLDAGEPIHLMGHSQGGLIVSRALRQVAQTLTDRGLSPDDVHRRLSSIKVETFGAAACTYPDGPRYVHYVNLFDSVPEAFGLAFEDGLPTKWAGAGAVVERFFKPRFYPFGCHNLVEAYLPARLPFDEVQPSAA